MEISQYWWIVGIISLIVHEIGHAIIAKRQGIYKGWGILPTPHIKLEKPFKNWYDYLSGIVFSMITIPLWLLVGISWWLSIILLISIGMFDFFPIIGWKHIKPQTTPSKDG